MRRLYKTKAGRKKINRSILSTDIKFGGKKEKIRPSADKISWFINRFFGRNKDKLMDKSTKISYFCIFFHFRPKMFIALVFCDYCAL